MKAAVLHEVNKPLVIEDISLPKPGPREVEAEKPSPNFERVFRKVAEQPKGFPPKANGGSASASSRRSSRKGHS